VLTLREPEPDSTILTALSDIMTPCKCDGLHCGGAPTLDATTVLAVGSVHKSHRVPERARPEN